MGEYEETLKDIEKTWGSVPGPTKALPKEALVHEWAVIKKFTIEEIKIPAKYRELIELAAAASLRCPYTVNLQRLYAKSVGATDDEINEVTYLAGLISRWSTMYHGMDYDLETFKKEIKEFLED